MNLPDLCAYNRIGGCAGSMHEWHLTGPLGEDFLIVICKAHEWIYVWQSEELPDWNCGCRLCRR